ncbi:amino acid adenylation domain-containing protein [Kitasatospora aureofaciens]|uniref:amino acid adenylation domain-containing protein n=1 Tax=Kitasatospora aureofaciens TaxID=1894 RepID=UPI0038273B5E
MSRPPLPPRPDRGRAPLSYAQQSIWRTEQRTPGTALHNETAAFRLTGPVDAEALERTLAALAVRHEMMRCHVLVDAGGEPYQAFADALRPPVLRADLAGAPAGEREARLAEAVADASARPFDPDRPPLMRCHLFRLAEDEYLLLFVAHHILVDAWGFGVFLEALAAEYAAQTGADEGAAADPEPAVPDFGDYAAWQRTSTEGRERDLAYWRDRFGGEQPVTGLPRDVPAGHDLVGAGPSAADRPDDVAGALHHFTVPADLAAALAALGREQLASLPTVLLTAFCSVVGRFTGKDDLIVGMPVATRNRPALARVVGPLLNLMAHRADLTGESTFREALNRTREALKADLRHRETPFDVVVEELAASGWPPVFQLMYAYHSGPTTTLQLPGAVAVPAPSHSGTAKYDLSFFVRPRPSGELEATLEYRTATLCADTAAGLAEALLRLLRAAVEQPGHPAAALPLLTEAGYRRVVEEFNAADDVRPDWDAVPAALRALARQGGAAPAVADEGRALTREEADRAADRVAARLAAEYRVRPGDRVALRVRRGAELVPLITGIWRAGAVLVPLDEALPAARARHMLADSGAAVLIADRPSGEAGVAEADAAALLAEGAVGTVPFPDGPAADALAYLMYTSGSTGLPKGVAVPHGCVANLLHSVTRQPGITAADTLLAVTSITFDISVLELFAPLVAGARVVIAGRESVRDAAALGALISAHRPTLMQATPSLWRGLLDGGWPGEPGLRALSGGEALDATLAGRLLDRCAELWNLYGPTETTIWSTAGRILPGEPVTVGRPVARTACYVLDRDLRPVPRGAVGELVIGGAGVTAGYWNRPELTAAAFVPDPVRPEGGTVYRTGDLARHLPDGRIVVLGRADQQVKILGHRVETGEIEALLTAHPRVRQAAVVVDRDHPAGPRLAAFVVPAVVPAADGPGPALPEELRAYLRERLPAAVVPAVVAELAQLPLNTSGKVDRPELVSTAREFTTGSHEAPATATERALAVLWAEALGIEPDRVGRYDDFHVLGGNSISATRLLARARAALGGAPSLADFYADPTLAALALGIDRAPAPEGRVTPAPAPDGPLPLTDQQRQLWLLHRLDPQSPAYHLPGRISLDGPVDVAALDAALGDLAARHEVLGARCDVVDGRPVLVRNAAPVRLTVVELADEERAFTDAAEAEAARPFDLAAGPLLRATLLSAPGGRRELLLTAHHIAVDGWSIGVALRDLAALYAARTGAGDPPPAPLVGYAEYAAGHHADSEHLDDEHLAHWTRRLDGYAGRLELPADGTDGSAPAGRVPFGLDPELTARLREVAARLRTTPFTVLATAFAALLGRWTGTDDVVVGIPVANRDRAELDDVVGTLVNTLPVRLDVSPAPGFADLVARTGRTLAADLDRPLVPMDRLVAGLGVDRDPTRPALIQAVLVWQDAHPAELRLGAARGELRAALPPVAKYDLALAMDEHPDRVGGVLEHDGRRLGPDAAARFTVQLRTLLRAALADPDAPLDAVDLADPADHRVRPARPFGAARAEHPVPLHELFRRQAEATPEAVAVRHDDTAVDYRTLDARSDAIAVRLAGLGAAPGEFVAVLVPAGAAQSTAVLGVAKTGAAFVVLNPADTALRIGAVLDDARPVCVLAAEESLARHQGLCGENTFGTVPVALLDAIAQEPAEPLPNPPADGADPLCLVYTSGSSGTPKGIVLSHAAFTQFAAWQRELLEIGPGSNVAQWAPFTYDAAYTEVFVALCSGATLCLPPDGARRDPVAIVDWLRTERITVFETVPGFFRLVTAALDAAGGSLPELRHVLLSGEALAPALAEAWTDRPDGPRLHNNYGPTECILATHRMLTPGERFPGAVPIGRPIPGREVLVLDHHGRPCPVGVPGEIHLRSDFLAGAYHRRPEETGRAYTADPWQPDGRLYRTGDLGRWLPDGDLAFLGRIGRQVKIRGNRVELDGVEAVLEAHPEVREAAATVHTTAGGAQQLVGYAVAAPGVTGADLRAHLAERLPAAAVPDTVMLLEALPRTRSNKRDRNRLPVPAAPAPAAEVTPLAGVEQLIADGWRTVLGGGPVGRHTNFFEAGGNSMLAAMLQLDLSRRLGREVRLVDLFTRPTIADFAAALTEAPAGAPAAQPSQAEDRGARRRAALRGRPRT